MAGEGKQHAQPQDAARAVEAKRHAADGNEDDAREHEQVQPKRAPGLLQTIIEHEHEADEEQPENAVAARQQHIADQPPDLSLPDEFRHKGQLLHELRHHFDQHPVQHLKARQHGDDARNGQMAELGFERGEERHAKKKG